MDGVLSECARGPAEPLAQRQKSKPPKYGIFNIRLLYYAIADNTTHSRLPSQPSAARRERAEVGPRRSGDARRASAGTLSSAVYRTRTRRASAVASTDRITRSDHAPVHGPLTCCRVTSRLATARRGASFRLIRLQLHDAVQRSTASRLSISSIAPAVRGLLRPTHYFALTLAPRHTARRRMVRRLESAINGKRPGTAQPPTVRGRWLRVKSNELRPDRQGTSLDSRAASRRAIRKRHISLRRAAVAQSLALSQPVSPSARPPVPRRLGSWSPPDEAPQHCRAHRHAKIHGDLRWLPHGMLLPVRLQSLHRAASQMTSRPHWSKSDGALLG